MAGKRSAWSEAVARGEIYPDPIECFLRVAVSRAQSRVLRLRWFQPAATSRTMFCKPVEFAGPINLMSILSAGVVTGRRSSSIKAAKRRNGSGLKLAAGNQTTTTRLVAWVSREKTVSDCLDSIGYLYRSHSSHGSSKARSIEGASGVGFGALAGLRGGQVVCHKSYMLAIYRNKFALA